MESFNKRYFALFSMAVLLALAGNSYAQCLLSSENPTCSNENDGSIVVFLNDGSLLEKKYDIYVNGVFDTSLVSITPYTYEALGAGVYRVEMYVKGDPSWEFSCRDSIALVAPSALKATHKATHIVCKGDTTGAIDMTLSGGTTPYNIKWNTNDTIEDLNKLVAGSYSALIFDAQSCFTIVNVDINEPAQGIEASFAATGNKCWGEDEGFINMSVSGGTTPYSYSWSNGATTQDINKLTAGTYTVNITDVNNCTGRDSAEVTQPADAYEAVIVSTDISCTGANDGTASLTINGGTPPYIVKWPTLGIDSVYSVDNLSEASYVVNVTDSDKCVAQTIFTINDPLVLSTRLDLVDTDCSQIEGTINLTVSGGTPPFTFDWSNGETTEDLEETQPDNYEVLVTDSRGCFVSDTITFVYTPIQCVSVPSAFTPNGDGINDVWIIKNLDILNGTVEVYDINGQQVYNSSTNPLPWDGIWQGSNLEQGTYYYVIVLGASDEIESGAVTVIR